MNTAGTWNISIQQIQIFLKAVELRNFTKVAEFYSFTPSMVSKTISALEAELDIRLFSRKPHELKPTPAAELLAREWRQLIGAIEGGIKKAQAYQDQPLTTIYLGFVDSSDKVDHLISHALHEYKTLHPEVTVIAEKHDMHRTVELLNSGLLDLVLTGDLELPYLEEYGLPWEKIYDTSVCIYVPESSELFLREELTYSDISGSDIIALDFRMHPSYKRWLDAFCRSHGFTPNIKATYRTVRSLLFNLRLNNAIFVGDSITEDWCDETLKAFLLSDQVFTLAAWKKDPHPEVLGLKDIIKQRYKAELVTGA